MAKNKVDPQEETLKDLNKLMAELEKHASSDAEIRKQANPQANAEIRKQAVQQASAESLLLGVGHKLLELRRNQDFKDKSAIAGFQSEANKFGAKAYLREIEKHFLDIDNNSGDLSRHLKDIIDKKKIVDKLQEAGGGKYLDEEEKKHLSTVEKRWEEQKSVVDIKYAYFLYTDLAEGKTTDPDKTLHEIKGILKKRGVNASALNSEGKMPGNDRDSNITAESQDDANNRLKAAYEKANFKIGKKLLEDVKSGPDDLEKILKDMKSRFAKSGELPKGLDEEIKMNAAIGHVNRAYRKSKSLEENGDPTEFLPGIKKDLALVGQVNQALSDEDKRHLDDIMKTLEKYSQGNKQQENKSHVVPQAKSGRQH